MDQITTLELGKCTFLIAEFSTWLLADYCALLISDDNISDDIDFIIITSKSGDNFGQFIFPKSVLVDKGIITRNDKAGKRGIRVYPPWNEAGNKQAQKTQNWQEKYFLTIKYDNTTDMDLIKKLFKENGIK